MYTGWRPNLKFPLNRPLDDMEKAEALTRDAADDPSFDERGGLVALNSTYIEWVDRRFRARGSGSTFLATVSMLVLLVLAPAQVLVVRATTDQIAAHWIAAVAAVGYLLIAATFYCLQVRIDFFRKVYYPIRFNRRDRMVYVYRDKRDGGILRVPWDEVFFHVGQGMMDKDLVDVRGEVMDDGTVIDTFALGPYYPDFRKSYARQAWAFICRYMEHGPKGVGPDPRDRYVATSLRCGLSDCASTMYTNYPPINGITILLSAPMIAVTAITRWLVFKTCRMPKWPEDIEKACAVDADDPNVWPQPAYTGQFHLENPEIKERLDERRRENARRARGEAPGSDLASQFADW